MYIDIYIYLEIYIYRYSPQNSNSLDEEAPFARGRFFVMIFLQFLDGDHLKSQGFGASSFLRGILFVVPSLGSSTGSLPIANAEHIQQ